MNKERGNWIKTELKKKNQQQLTFRAKRITGGKKKQFDSETLRQCLILLTLQLLVLLHRYFRNTPFTTSSNIAALRELRRQEKVYVPHGLILEEKDACGFCIPDIQFKQDLQDLFLMVS